MSLSIITNIGATTAVDQLTTNQLALNQTIAQLSSGKRIVTAADDPAGLAIAMETQGTLGALGQASSNVQNALALLKTADGGLSNIGSLLQTAQQLATEASDGSFNSSQLAALDGQFQAILSSIDQIANGSTFNGISLFSGSSITFQVGGTASANDQLAVTLPQADTTTLAVAGLDLTTQANAQAALTAVTSAVQTVANSRGSLGASEQQLSSIGANLQSTSENLTNALSVIQDANIAQTYANFTKESVLQQAGVQVLRHAEAAPSQLLALFQ